MVAGERHQGIDFETIGANFHIIKRESIGFNPNQPKAIPHSNLESGMMSDCGRFALGVTDVIHSTFGFKFDHCRLRLGQVQSPGKYARNNEAKEAEFLHVEKFIFVTPEWWH